jgi:hypothetical protein
MLCYGAAPMGKSKKPANKAWLLGLGLDNKDGHTRITTGEDFKLLGGSQETHSVMQEKAMKLNEHLSRRGKTLSDITQEEFHEIADKLGMNVVDPPRTKSKARKN